MTVSSGKENSGFSRSTSFNRSWQRSDRDMNRPVAVAREQFKKRLKSEEQDDEKLIQVSFISLE